MLQEIAAASAAFLALTKMQSMPARAEMAAIRKYFNLTSINFILPPCGRSLVLQAVAPAALSSRKRKYSAFRMDM
jgi:hypothetical protein